ncbi:MAG: hemolysin family protein [Acidobacteriota bacterium]|nr:hemolysin family protein [Blastocatellia bacterium]MDW8238528.1 hemolysin family protein [Acidobacteriota bacterium]
MMSVTFHISLILILTLLLVFLSTIQSAVNELSEVQLRVLLAEHEQSLRHRLLKIVVEDYQLFLLTLGLGGQVLIVSITILVSTLFGQLPATNKHPLLWAFVTMCLVIGLFRQLVPQLVAQINPSRVLLLLLPPLSIVYRGLHLLAAPLHWVIQRQRQKLQSAFDQLAQAEEEDTDEEEIQAFIDVGEEEGILEEGEAELIQSIVELGDRRVTELMTPRSEIVAVRHDTSIMAALNTIIETRFSRIPIYRDHLDNIEGIVYLRDLLKCWRAGQAEEPVAHIARPAYFVPETKLAGDLLEEMRHSHTHIALVIDEFGGLAGLITIEDLLEEIVGEIQEEELDEVADEVHALPDGSFLVSGSVEIRRVEQLVGTEIEADDFTTVAGLIIRELDRLPDVGEQLHFKNLLFEVVAADGRRVQKVRIKPTPSA